jgi:hypothetical protein
MEYGHHLKKQGSNSDKNEGSEKIAFRAEHVTQCLRRIHAANIRIVASGGTWILGFKMHSKTSGQKCWMYTLRTCCVPWVCVEQQIALFPCIDLGHKKTCVYLSVQKKTQAWGQGEWGLVQAMKRGFRGIFCSVCPH